MQNFMPGMVIHYGMLWYRVEGVYLGGETSVSLIGLSPITETPGCVENGRQGEMFVPEAILRASLTGFKGELFTPVRD